MPTSQLLLEILFKSYGLRFFDKGTYNLNIFGVRAKDQDTNLFDDLICVAFFTEAGWYTCAFPATVDPGTTFLGKVMGNTFGTAILPISTIPGVGQYRFRLGHHRGSYPALVQGNEFTIVRDADQNGVSLSPEEIEKLLKEGRTDKGWFGINIHRATPHGVSVEVGNWSAGCQVIQSSFDWEKFIRIVMHSSKIFGDLFSYTLFAEEDIKNTLGLSIDSFHYLMNKNRYEGRRK